MGHEPTQYPFPVASGGMREGQGAEVFALREYLSQDSPRTDALRNGSMQGAVVGVIGSGGAWPTNWSNGGIPTGVTATILGFGSAPLPNGGAIDYLDVNYAGINSGAATAIIIWTDLLNSIAATLGQEWCSSMYLQVLRTDPAVTALAVTATGTNGATQTEVNQSSLVPPPSQAMPMARVSTVLAVLNAGTTNIQQRLFTNPIAAGATINFTVRIASPQLEQGNFPTAVIRTTGAAASRSRMGAVRQPDLGGAPKPVSITGFGTGSAFGMIAGRGKECDRSQGTVQIFVGSNPSASGTIILDFTPNVPAAMFVSADWATLTTSIAGNQLTINWTASPALQPFQTPPLTVTYQWAVSQ